MSTGLVAAAGPLFIGGMPRSGTKLLRVLLNRHPGIAVPEIETELLPLLQQRAASGGPWSDRVRFAELRRGLAGSASFEYAARAGAPVSAAAWYSACPSFDAAGIFEGLVRAHLGLAPSADVVWGDKSPSFIDDLPLIAQLCPAARVVHIVRDVRDYCLSIHAAWGKDMLRAAQRWREGVERAHADGRAILGARYLELRYEDLLADVPGTLQRVCALIERPFVDDMTRLMRPSDNLGDARGMALVVSDNHDRYLPGMAPALLHRIEAIAGTTMERFGYTLACERQPYRPFRGWQMRLAQARDGLALVRQASKERGIVGAALFHVRYAVDDSGEVIAAWFRGAQDPGGEQSMRIDR